MTKPYFYYYIIILLYNLISSTKKTSSLYRFLALKAEFKTETFCSLFSFLFSESLTLTLNVRFKQNKKLLFFVVEIISDIYSKNCVPCYFN